MKLKFGKDWKTIKLDDALDYVIGGDWGKDENYEDINYGLAYCIRGSEIKNWEIDKGNTASLRKIKLNNIEKRKLQEGDILVEISGGGPEQPVGRTILIDKTTLRYKSDIPKISTNFLRLMRPKKEFDGKFLNLYLKLFYYSGEVVKYQGGSNNLRNLKFPDFVKINIPFPPLETQQIIVSKIEELFSELDKGIEDLKTAQQQLKTYRQSVLKWAFEGKLTNENVKDGELPEGWEMVKIGDIVNMQSGVAFKKAEYSKEGIRLFQIANVSFNYTKWDDIAHLPKEYIESHKHLLLNKGDIVLALNRPMLNNQLKIAELKQSDVPAILYQRVGRFTFDENLNKRYFLYYFQSSIFLKWLGEQLQGVNIPFINKSKLFSYDKFPLPNSVGIQERVIQEIERRLSVADKMEESIALSLLQAESLRQSILKKAFSGELV